MQVMTPVSGFADHYPDFCHQCYEAFQRPLGGNEFCVKCQGEGIENATAELASMQERLEEMEAERDEVQAELDKAQEYITGVVHEIVTKLREALGGNARQFPVHINSLVIELEATYGVPDSTAPLPTPAPNKAKRGRPKGSKNKPKETTEK